MTQINHADAPRKRGRPKKEGETKQASVRVRNSLQQRLVEAAARSGQSAAAELESRLESTFEDPPMREPTRTLLRQIGQAIHDLEQLGRPWDKSLQTWAMVREILANGPIVETVPHPDPLAVKEMTARNERLVALKVEKDTLTKSLVTFGVSPLGEDAMMFGARMFGFHPNPDRSIAKDEIDAMTGLPEQVRKGLIGQVDRLDEIDAEISEITEKLHRSMAPYMEARKAAQRVIYEMNGRPSLPIWLTAPVGMDETPPRPAKRGMFAGR